MSQPSLLISLPHGFNASGVTAWAVRLANALAGAGRPVGIVAHDEPVGQRRVEFGVDPRVDVFEAHGLPPLDTCNGDLSDVLPVYRVALGALALRSHGAPVVCVPNLVGDSFGVFAALSRETPDLVRTVAVHHSDLAYNDAVLRHYAPHISAFVGVSERLAVRVRAMLPNRHTDVFGIPYGVETQAHLPRRVSLTGRALRLLYAGRLDHEQKRVRALGVMADALAYAGVPFELAILGDGPASDEMDRLAGAVPGVRRFVAVPPTGVAQAMDSADFFVLPSRYEGLSVALLEALAHGCVPVLTPSRSGTAQLIAHGRTGFLASAGPEDSPESAGEALADAIVRAARSGDQALDEVRRAGWSLVRSRFDAGLCATRYASVIDRVARSRARPWRADQPAPFTGSGGGGSGTVPVDAAHRMATTLGRLVGRRVAIFGTGRHTVELRDTILGSGAEVVAFLDDDGARQGGTLWGRPILRPGVGPLTGPDGDARGMLAMGVTDVVVSSWIHEHAMVDRCEELARVGVEVHGLYARAACTPGVAI